MDAEVAHAQPHETTHGIEQLLFRHAELCLRRLAEDAVREGELARVEPEAHGPGDLLDRIQEGVDVSDVVQVDGGPQARGVGELLGGGVVRGEHDLLASDAEPLRHLELALRRDVEAKAHVEERLENPGVGARLHGIELAVAGVPAERVQHRPCGRAYARLVVKVERRGVRGGDVLQLACRCKGTLAAHVSSYAAILCDGPLAAVAWG